MSGLDVFQLSFVHPEVVAQFVEHRLSDFVTDFGFGTANGFDVFLVENDASGPGGEVEHTALGGRPTLIDSQNQAARFAGTAFRCGSPRLFRLPWPVFDEDGEVVDPLAEFLRKRFQYFLDQADEVLLLHRASLRGSFVPQLSIP
jgi:hypothetical protein